MNMKGNTIPRHRRRSTRHWTGAGEGAGDAWHSGHRTGRNEAKVARLQKEEPRASRPSARAM